MASRASSRTKGTLLAHCVDSTQSHVIFAPGPYRQVTIRGNDLCPRFFGDQDMGADAGKIRQRQFGRFVPLAIGKARFCVRLNEHL